MGSTLDGVTTACVLFLFTCLVIPDFIKNRTQYFAALGCVLGIIVINTLSMMIGSPKFQVFGGVVVGFLQIVTVAMLVMCAGGMNAKSLAGEMRGAYEVIRRGEEEKEIIVPLTGAMPKKRGDDAIRERINIDSPPAPIPQPKPLPPEGGIPLE